MAIPVDSSKKRTLPASPEELAYLSQPHQSPYGTSVDGGPATYPAGMASIFSGGTPRTDYYDSESGQQYWNNYQNWLQGSGSQQWQPPDYYGSTQFQQGSTPINQTSLASRFPDSWQRLVDAMKGGYGGQQTIQDLLANFQGSEKDLQKFMENPAWRAALAYSPRNTDAYQQLAHWQDPTKQALSAGLGQISAAGARGVSDAIASLNQAGMGRNVGAVAAAKSGGQLDTASKSAQYKAAVNQQIGQNELARLGQLLDLEQNMAQIALGFSPQPRQPSNKASAGDWAALAGSIIGGVVKLA